MKRNWYKDANYSYETQPDKKGYTKIVFTFPNAAGGLLQFDTWLYRFKHGDILEKNMTAEMLQCYIDLERDKA